MTRYLLSICQPDGDPPPEVMERMPQVMRDVGAFLADSKTAGAWVFNAALHAPSTATVVRLQDGEVLMTDGPYTEGKEHIGGLVVIQVADLDAALDWAARLARAITLPIEVRPIQAEDRTGD